jgi:surface-anchored protein
MRRPRWAGLELERLEDRAVPDSTFYKLLTTEHVDLGFDYVGGQWEGSSEIGTSNPNDSAIDYAPDKTLHYVHPGARANRPAGAQWDFIGVPAGQPIYILPQAQDPGLMFLGIATEETPSGTFAAYSETDPRVSSAPIPWVTTRVTAVRGPGQFAVWQSGTFGTPIVWVSSADGLGPTDKLLNLEGGHVHYNWAFTAPGFYEIDLQASAVLSATGQVSQSPVHTFYFVVDDNLKVTSVTPTETGFLARLNRPIDLSTLNLYDAAGGTLGAADVTLVGTNTGPVRGSLVVPTALIPNQTTGVLERTKAINAVEFVATGGPLPADTYTVTLRGENVAYASNTGFRTTSTPANQGVLDGDGNGTTGDSFVGTFVVSSTTARTVSVPDFARGFGQAANVPANGAGIPVAIDNAGGITRVTFDLLYDPALLNITAAARGGDVPAAFTVTLDTTVAGRARVTLDGGSTALPAGPLTLLNLTAAVPATAPYADKGLLRFVNLQVNSGAIAARADHGVHVSAFVGDVTGDRTYSGLDAALIARLASGQGTGFTAFQNADPVLVADTSANGALSGLDASLLAQKVVGRPVPLLPDVPAAGAPSAGGPDPRLFLPTNLSGAPGATVTVPVRIEVTEPGGVSFQAADYAIAFDPARFTVSNARVAGTLLDGFTVLAEIDNAAGVVRVSTYSANPVALATGTIGDVLRLDFTVKPSATAGATPLNLRNSSGTTRTALNEGQLTLAPVPTDGAADANVDGTFTVDAATLGVTDFRVNDGAAQRSRVTRLRVTFGSAVPGLTAANFQLTGFTGTLTVTPNAGNTEYTLTFSGAGTEHGSLRDGRYTLNVLNVAGLTGATSLAFHRLFGDADGDQDVDARDLSAFRQAFGNTTNLAAFDGDADGDVDRADYRRLLRQYGKRV